MRLVDRLGSEADRLDTLDHVMACAECRRDFELLRAVREARDEAAPARRVVTSRVLALAASAVVLFGAGLVWQLNRGPSVDVLRGGERVFTLVAPAGTVGVGDPIDFVWRAATDVVRYRFEILDAAGALVFDTTTKDTALTFEPASVLRVGEEYRWWVRARTTDGGAVPSELLDFTLRRD